jgi:hypothetical protein
MRDVLGELRLLAALFAELLDGVQENLLKIRLGLEADDDDKSSSNTGRNVAYLRNSCRLRPAASGAAILCPR